MRGWHKLAFYGQNQYEPRFSEWVPELAVLRVLADGPAHGYVIVQGVARRTGCELEFGEGSIYPVLHKLEQEGLLKSRREVARPLWFQQLRNALRERRIAPRDAQRFMDELWCHCLDMKENEPMNRKTSEDETALLARLGKPEILAAQAEQS
jgi:hypothetical protein